MPFGAAGVRTSRPFRHSDETRKADHGENQRSMTLSARAAGCAWTHARPDIIELDRSRITAKGYHPAQLIDAVHGLLLVRGYVP